MKVKSYAVDGHYNDTLSQSTGSTSAPGTLVEFNLNSTTEGQAWSGSRSEMRCKEKVL